MSLFQQDRTRRTRFDPYIDRYNRGPEIYFDNFDLSLGPEQSFNMYGQGPRGFGHRGSMDGDRDMDRRSRRLSPREDEYIDPRPGQRIMRRSRNPNGISFGKAISKLFAQLEQAIQVYRSFQQSYDEEISLIKEYTSRDILTSLWILRVKGKKAREDSEIEDGQDGAFAGQAKKLQGMGQKLRQAMDEAVNSTINEQMSNSQKNKALFESNKRLQEKVYTTTGHILELLPSVSTGRDNCEALIGELELLRSTVDPDRTKKSEAGDGDYEQQDNYGATDHNGEY
ncbi:hypothetical protein B7494_g5119 [Chlorociboria aeruginascens]|nr:hypothetical protein B7494_g5119 [Chlorociboria aeruginascens]